MNNVLESIHILIFLNVILRGHSDHPKKMSAAFSIFHFLGSLKLQQAMAHLSHNSISFGQ